jgi:hypothetical protein
MTLYNNVPKSSIKSSSDATVQYFNTFYQTPIYLNDADIAAVTGFFETNGFDHQSADSVAMIILSQAKSSNINAFQLLDSLKQLDGVGLSTLVGQVMNYNRFKTSSLGTSNMLSTADEIQRNILA